MGDGRIHFVKADTLRSNILDISDYSDAKSYGEYNLSQFSLRRKGNNKSKENKYPLLTHKSAPAVPTKFQQNGYIEMADGRLKPKDPLPLGFSGLGNDTPGPGDFDPRPQRLRALAPVSFARSPRQSVANSRAWLGADVEVPGPGHYNARSTFNDPANALDEEGDASRRAAVFRSKVTRDCLAPPTVGSEAPGPASYNIPPTIKTQQTAKSQQCFSSSSTRFNNTVPRSMRLSTCPGAYSPVTSDFEINRLKIRRSKQRQWAGTRGWEGQAAFQSTASRFHKDDLRDRPEPVVDPRDDESRVVRERDRSRSTGSFGTTAKRFYMPNAELEREALQPQSLSVPTLKPPQLDPHPMELEVPARIRSPLAARHPSEPPMSVFRSRVARLAPDASPVAPAVGSYDLDLPQRPKGVVPMMVTASPRAPAPSPGPGSYEIPSPSRSPGRNRKDVMLSSSERFQYKDVTADLPGPGAYDPAPLTGSLMVHSHNVRYLTSTLAHLL